MRVLFFGTYDERTHPRIEVLREGLQAHGVAVEVCNHPIGLSTADRVELVRRPWRMIGRLWAVLQTFARLRRDALSREGPFDAVVVGYLGVFDVRLARRWFDGVVVLDHMAPVAGTFEDRGITGGRARVASLIDRKATDAADIVLVDTPEHAPAGGAKALVVEVGASHRWFNARRTRADGALRAVFFGLYTPLQGVETVAAAVAATADRVDWTLIGKGQDRAVLDDALAPVDHAATVLDWVDSAELPGVVAGHDVCLGIFGTTPKASRVVPNKVFQGAATGCIVITSDTDPQRRALGDGAILVPAGDSDALVAALDGLVADAANRDAQRARSAALADERFKPEVVVAPLVEALRRGH